jgi:hypothetical protein
VERLFQFVVQYAKLLTSNPDDPHNASSFYRLLDGSKTNSKDDMNIGGSNRNSNSNFQDLTNQLHEIRLEIDP